MNNTDPAAPLDEEDYRAIEQVLRESGRGRRFLDEYVRRHAAPDTDTLLKAIARLERALATQTSALIKPVGELHTVSTARETASAIVQELNHIAATLGPASGGSATASLRQAVVAQGTALRDATRRLQGAHGRLRADGTARDEIKRVVDMLKDLSGRHIALAHTLSTAIDGLDRLLEAVSEPADGARDIATGDPDPAPQDEAEDGDGGIVIIRTPASPDASDEAGDEHAQPALDLDASDRVRSG